MNIQQRITKLEQIKTEQGKQDIPALVYFTGGNTEYTPDKKEAFIKYKERWQDDSRYGHIVSRFDTVDDLETYCEASNLPARNIINVQFIGVDTPELATL